MTYDTDSDIIVPANPRIAKCDGRGCERREKCARWAPPGDIHGVADDCAYFIGKEDERGYGE